MHGKRQGHVHPGRERKGSGARTRNPRLAGVIDGGKRGGGSTARPRRKGDWEKTVGKKQGLEADDDTMPCGRVYVSLSQGVRGFRLEDVISSREGGETKGDEVGLDRRAPGESCGEGKKSQDRHAVGTQGQQGFPSQ